MPSVYLELISGISDRFFTVRTRRASAIGRMMQYSRWHTDYIKYVIIGICHMAYIWHHNIIQCILYCNLKVFFHNAIK